MKKIALVLSLAFLVFSCSDDDDSGSGSDLVGTWKITSESYDGEDYPLSECELQNTITFTDSKITETDLYSLGVEGECEDDGTETYSYTSTSSTITASGFTSSYVINGSNLVITYDYEEDFNDDGSISEDEKSTVVETYVKQ